MVENTVFVGDKPFMNYVTSVVVQFSSKEAQEVLIKARGRFINRAVDIAEVVKNKFLQNLIDTKKIEIDTEEFISDQGKEVGVSTIKITLSRI